MLAGLLTPQWESQHFSEQWLAWERSVVLYEDASHRRLPDEVKCATLARWSPAAVKEFLRVAPADVMISYARLREAIQTFLSRGRAYDQQGMQLVTGPEAMEVDAVKGKGKGQPSWTGSWSRGNVSSMGRYGNVQGQEQGWWMRSCRWCGGKHLDRDCRKHRTPSRTSPKVEAKEQPKEEAKEAERRCGELPRELSPLWQMGPQGECLQIGDVSRTTIAGSVPTCSC
jgi:hypothetical protein